MELRLILHGKAEPAINGDGKFFHKLMFNTELGISFLLTADFLTPDSVFV